VFVCALPFPSINANDCVPQIQLSLLLFMAATRMEDRGRYSKSAMAMHHLAYGGDRALFDARYSQATQTQTKEPS
jgi:hypothetical protein